MHLIGEWRDIKYPLRLLMAHRVNPNSCPLMIAKFVHIVDSRVPLDPLSVKDEGLFNKQENGDDLETGSMRNPDTGLIMKYEEVWRTIPITADKIVLLESCGVTDKAFIGRIGKWFQGIGTMEGHVNAVRGEYVDGKWRTVFTIGNQEALPYFTEHDGWKVDDEVELAGRKWKVLACE